MLTHERAGDAAYRGDVEDSWKDIRPQVRAYADHVAAEIERARAGIGPYRAEVRTIDR